MIPMLSAIASQIFSSRRRPGLWAFWPPVVFAGVGSPAICVGSVKIASGRNAPTTQLGASTSSWMRRSTAVEAIA